MLADGDGVVGWRVEGGKHTKGIKGADDVAFGGEGVVIVGAVAPFFIVAVHHGCWRLWFLLCVDLVRLVCDGSVDMA